MHVSLYAFSLFTSLLIHSFTITPLEQSINFAYLKILKQPLQYKNAVENFEISSDQMIFHPPHCAFSTGGLLSGQIDYKDCTVFSVLNMTITVKPSYTFTLENFYIEYHYPGIHFKLINEKKVSSSFTEDQPITPIEEKFSFNRNRAPLPSSYFKPLVTLLEKSALETREKFKDRVKETISTEETLSTLESHLSSSFILLNLNSIVTETNHPIVTYYSFLPTLMDNVINLKEITVVGKMTARFEYSVGYNLTYQEGSFDIYNFGFDVEFLTEKDALEKYGYDHFIPNKEKDEVKKYLLKRFKEHLMIAINKFYSLKNQNTVSNEPDLPIKVD